MPNKLEIFLDYFEFYTAIIGFFTGLLNIWILTRKELRVQFVFIILIAIGIFDLLLILDIFFTRITDFSYFQPTVCKSGSLYPIIIYDKLDLTLIPMTRNSLAFLTLIMTVIRTLVLIFPLNRKVQKFTSPKSAIIMIFLVVIVCSGWEGSLTIHRKIVKVCQKANETTYDFDDTSDIELVYNQINGILDFILSVVYLFLTVFLSVAIRKAKKNRQMFSRSKEGPDNTAKLVLAISVVYFMVRVPWGLYWFFDEYVYENYTKFWNQWYSYFYQFLSTMFIFNALFHSVCCFFMSTVYRNTGKRMFGFGKSRDATATQPVFQSTTLRL